jgi:aminoglycoside phosphotransferase (APT) family kinase protein
MHADEVPIGDELVRALVDDQFPEWSPLTLVRTPSTGTDNAIYRLGDHLAVRLPRIHWAVRQIDKELEWLPRLAPHLPVAVAAPVARGEPGLGYPYPWLVYGWVEGTDAMGSDLGDGVDLGCDAAAFVRALQHVDLTGSRRAGNRGRLLAPSDESTRDAIRRTASRFDVDATALVQVWEEALAAAPWDRPPVWVHADLLPGNLLLRDGRLVAVIDWSAAGLGDPACDTMLAWALPPAGRAAFREALDVDDATWARGRGWTVEQAVHFIPYYEHTIPAGVAAARQRLAAVVAG